jgi:hypothetical protein
LQFDLISFVSAGGIPAHQDKGVCYFHYEPHEKWHNMGDSELRQICNKFGRCPGWIFLKGDLGSLKG